MTIWWLECRQPFNDVTNSCLFYKYCHEHRWRNWLFRPPALIPPLEGCGTLIWYDTLAYELGYGSLDVASFDYFAYQFRSPIISTAGYKHRYSIQFELLWSTRWQRKQEIDGKLTSQNRGLNSMTWVGTPVWACLNDSNDTRLVHRFFKIEMHACIRL